MTVRKRRLILANSAKNDDRCVAGREVIPTAAGGYRLGPWVRPLRGHGRGELWAPEHSYPTDRSVAVFDIADVDLAGEVPDPGQPNTAAGCFVRPAGRGRVSLPGAGQPERGARVGPTPSSAEGVRMASDITLGDAHLGVANRRLFALLDFGLKVGEEAAGSEAARGWVAKLRTFDENAWPGISFDLAELFPSADEKKFWAQVYHDVARLIFLRRIGNQEVTSWQSSAIGDAYIIARLLTRAVQVELAAPWHPDTEDTSQSHYNGRVDLRL